MQPIIHTSGDVTSFIGQCQAFELIDSAVAVIDAHQEILFQNAAFARLTTPRTRQLALLHTQNLITANSEFIQAAQQVWRDRTSASVVVNIPFNSILFLSVTADLNPVMTINNEILCVMLTINEESISNTMEQQVQRQEKFRLLGAEIQKLSKENLNNKSLIKSLLSKTPFGIIIMDENQQVIQINNAASKILNTDVQSTIGKHCTDYFNCYQLYDGCPVLQNNEDLSQQEISSCNLKPADKILMKSSAKIVFENRPAILEAFVDISDKIQYERDLLDAIISTEKANMAKTEFLSNMSHELRTPLHAVLGFSRLGQSKIHESKEKLAEYFRKIQLSGTTLLNLLNNLLDLSKMEAGKAQLNLNLISLNEPVTLISQELQPLLLEKQQQLSLNLKTDLPPTNLDAEKIKQVIRNLLGNAIKFTPHGGLITINTNQTNTDIEFTIEDTGPGVPADELEAIFDKFIQSSKTKSGAGGTGLGLSICREIIRLHKGQIKALAFDSGSKFVFTLPLKMTV